MSAFVFSLFLICTTAATVNTQLITSPPKLELESKGIVWFQIAGGGSAQKFELLCLASGDPEKYQWYKNDEPLLVDNEKIVWQRAGQSGTIMFLKPDISDQGFYQCRAINIFGVAVSNIFEVRLGTLDHFSSNPVRQVVIEQGDPLTLPCKKPFGIPEPSLFWLFRNVKESFVIETINKPHITVDGDGSLQFSYVDLHDGRENLVYQCAATSPVLHGEYRAGDEFRLIVKPSASKPRLPKKAWFSPSDIRISAEEALKLTCIFAGYPLPEVKWTKRGDSLPKSRVSHENFGKTLVIKPVYPSDEGVYVCDSGNIQHRMTVHITTAPHWIDEPPRNLDLPEESDADLKCRAAGEPLPVVRWYKNGKPIEEADGHHHRRTILHNGEILRITNLHHKTDRGVYQCNASNPLGYIFANAFLNVRAHAPEFDTPLDQTIKAVWNKTVELDCAVKAAPLPKVVWVNKENTRIDPIPGKIELLKSHSLLIYSVAYNDKGEYFCDVSNKFGINKARRNLEVYAPTTFEVGGRLEPILKIIERGHQMEFYCLAKSDIRLEVTYVWQRDDIVINFNADPLFISTRQPNRIKLLSAKGRHSGVYKCLAQTEVDDVSSSMKLIVKDVPEAPVITDVQCEETHAIIKWLPAYDNHDNVTHYYVEYTTPFEPNIWKHMATVKTNSINISESFQSTVKLSPWVNYTFRVEAKNFYGRGSPGSLPGITCVTPASFPYENPANVTASGSIRDNLIVRWTPMHKELWNAPGLYYVVKYRPENSKSTDDSDWFERRIEDPFLDHTEIRDLPIFELFQVQVKAFNSMGESLEEPSTVIGYSGEDVPSVSPEDFQAEPLNGTSVKFSWKPVDVRSVNGHLRKYRIKTWQILLNEQRTVNVLRDVDVYKTRTETTVGHFEPMRRYASKVFVVNSYFEGPASHVVEFSTPEGAPDHVENLTAEAYGASTIYVMWSVPLQIRGYLTFYHIAYYVESRTGGATEEFHSMVPGDTTHHLYYDATPITNYTVNVWAQTGGGEGPKRSVALETWNETYPSTPKFLLEQLTSKSVLLTWIPNKAGLPGTCFHASYSRTDVVSWQTSKTECIPLRTITVDNLSPDVHYQFVVYSKDGKFSTASMAKFIKLTVNRTTSEQTGKSSERSLTGAAWFIAIICAVAVSLLSVCVICICHRNRGGKYPVKKKEVERNQEIEKDEKQLFAEYTEPYEFNMKVNV